jgi:crotonobetainyl-CoA:carnitine CoA-transferase CaiB-like acyl-CoA transferase
MADTRFATAAERKRNEEALDALLSDWLLNKDGKELEQALQAARVSACRIIKSYDLPEDPGLAHTGFFQLLTRAEIGDQLFKTWPFFFETIDAAHKRPAPLLGEHNEEILVGLLGLSTGDMQRLNAAGVIGQEPAGLADVNY